MRTFAVARIASIAVAVAAVTFGCLGSRPEAKKSAAQNQNDASIAGGGAGGGSPSSGGADSGAGRGGTAPGGVPGADAGGTSGASAGGSGGTSCVQGTDCSKPETPCKVSQIDCSSGSSMCKEVKNAADGKPCDLDQFCVTGICSPCQDGQACVPEAEPCKKGTMSCSSHSCVASTAPQDDGTPCDDHDLCTSDSDPTSVNQDKCASGECTGAPVVCTAKATCHKSGTCDPSTGCSDPLETNGTPCGVNGKGTCSSGSCRCANTDLLCAPDTCVSPLTDSKHCGMCDRDCYAGACSSGVCQPWVALPTSELGEVPPAFATDGKDLVWFIGGGSKIRKIAATGIGGTTTLVNYGDKPGRLALSSANARGERFVVWTSIDPATSRVNIYRIGISDSPNLVVPLKTLGTAGHSYEPVGLAVDATADHAYFQLVEDGTTATLQECSLTGNVVCASLGDVFPSPGGDDVVLGQGYVFWTEASKARVVRYSLSDGTKTDAATSQAGPYVLTTDSGYVYWADRSGSDFFIKRTLQATPNPTAAETILGGVQGTLTSLATDGGYVYYAGAFGRNGNDKVGYVLAIPGESGHPLFQDNATTEVPAGLLTVAAGAVYYYAPEALNIQGLASVR